VLVVPPRQKYASTLYMHIQLSYSQRLAASRSAPGHLKADKSMRDCGELLAGHELPFRAISLCIAASNLSLALESTVAEGQRRPIKKACPNKAPSALPPARG
jgi:hypothetical protein